MTETIEQAHSEAKENEVQESLPKPYTEFEYDLHELVKEVIDYYIYGVFPTKYEIIKSKKLFSGDLERAFDILQGEDHNMTVIRHNLTDHIHETFTKDLLSKDFSASMYPTQPKYKEYANDAQDAYDRAYAVSGYEKESHSAYYEASLLGYSFMMWSAQGLDLADNEDEEDEKKEENIPNATHVSIFELFTEPMATKFDSARYKIRRKIMSETEIVSSYSWIGLDETLEGQGMSKLAAINETSGEFLYDRDFRKIWHIESCIDRYKECCDGARKTTNGYIDDVYRDCFSINRAHNPLNEVIEYWEGSKLVVMINKRIMFDGNHPFGKKDPFSIIQYEETVGTIHSRGIGDKLLHLQREADLLQISSINGIKIHVFPDYISNGGIKDSSGLPIAQFQWSGEGKVVQVADSSMSGGQPFNPIQWVRTDMLQLANNRLNSLMAEAYQFIGINSYTAGGDGKVERNTAGVRERVEGSRARLKTIKKYINMALNKAYNVWLYLMIKGTISREILEKVDDDGNVSFAKLDAKSIYGRFMITIDSEGFKAETMKDRGQNLLNTSTALQNLLGDRFDNDEVAQELANDYNIKGIKILSEEEVKKKIDKQIAIEEYRQTKLLEMQMKLQQMQSGAIQQQPGAQPQPNPQEELPVIFDSDGNPIPPELLQGLEVQ